MFVVRRQQSATQSHETSVASVEPASAILSEVRRELEAWLPILRRLAEADSLRNEARSHSFEITSAAVRSIIAARRLRDDYFWPSMNENAWSVLLELFASRMEGSRLQVTDLCQATGLTPEIALHWADWLAGRGLVALRHVEGDASPVDLTDAGADCMRAYLLASLSLSPWVQ